MDEFAVLSGAVCASKAQVALLWWNLGVMNELAVFFLAFHAIIAELWLTEACAT